MTEANGDADRALASHHRMVMLTYWAGDMAASAFAMSLSASAFFCLSGMERARRSARSGSVAASALTTPCRAYDLLSGSVMERAMRAARVGWVAASACTTPFSADAFWDASRVV
jgi:hypothetical protein